MPERPERIAKYIARAGFCSRRRAEQFIRDGLVSVNGETLEGPVFLVSEKDKIIIDGRSLPAPSSSKLWAFYKPRGVLVSNKDPQNRPVIFAHLPASFQNHKPVGRLDMNSEGLLLLTNDGMLARQFELPENALPRHYRVRAHGRADMKIFDKMREGIEIEGILYRPIDWCCERKEGKKYWFSLILHEGKNREIRKLFAHAGLEVTRLIRTEYGPFKLAGLEKGEVREVKIPDDIRKKFICAGEEKAKSQSRSEKRKLENHTGKA